MLAVGKRLLFALILMCAAQSVADEIRVRVSPLEALAQVIEYSAPATVLSLQDSGLTAEISAHIDEVLFQVGDEVHADTPLIRLSCVDYRQNKQQAMAQLQALGARRDLAEQQLVRTRKLARNNNASEELLSQRVADLRALEAEVLGQRAMHDLASDKVERCIVKSPFAGVVTERYAQVGEYAQPGKQLLRLVNTDDLEVSADIHLDLIPRLTTGGDPLFKTTRKSYPIKIRKLLPVVNTITQNQEVRLHFVGERPAAGVSGRVTWAEPQAAIPADYLQLRGDSIGVLIADAGLARFIEIPHALEGRPATSDLPGDTLIITEGRFGLQPDQPIRIVD